MNYQQANPTNEEVSFNTGGNGDSKTADGPGYNAIVNAEAGDEPLNTVSA
jgi:hypothetical protein